LIRKIYKIPVPLFLIAIVVISVLFSSRDSYSQGRDRSKYQLIPDTSLSHIDTSLNKDTSLVHEPIDSTARIKYFKYERTDKLTPTFKDYRHPLLLESSSGIEYKLTFDSLNYVIINEYVNGQPTKIPLKIPFEKYLEARGKLNARNQFYKIVAEYYKIESKDDLEKLFKNISEISIPLPFTTETIFGPPTIKLNINGQIDITASYQKNSSDQATILQESNTQNNINFKQEVQVTTKGSIGDKLTIDADWNSQRTFDYENQLKLKYKGYPDEVVQSIEAGNVSLETKSNLIGSTQALFGVKGQFKLGPLTFTAIASQKKSEKKEVNITGGSQEVNFEIPAYNYSENHYFLDTVYRKAFEEYYRFGEVRTDTLKLKKVAPDIEVWVQTQVSNNLKRKAVGWIELGPRPSNGYDDTTKSSNPPSYDGHKWSGYFVKLNPGDFTLHPDAGYITLNINLSGSNDAVGVAYKLANNTEQYGTYSNEDSLVLKLIKYPNLQPPIQNPTHTVAWNLKIKNIYSVGVRNLKNDLSKFECNVYYKPASGVIQQDFNGRSFLRLVGLDLRTNTPTYDPNLTQPDGRFDFYPNYTIDLVAGEVIFPTLSPFYQTLKDSSVDTAIISVNNLIYTDSKYTAQNSTIKFYLGGKATGDASSRYTLGFNVVEGSVKVFNGSVQLVLGVDFTIDYSSGELIIRNAAALTAGANLKITYESNDLFQLASKTLLGTRLEYQINKTSYVGFTLLNLKQQTLNDKIRIGEEPTNNTILGFDASTDIKTNFVSNLLNKIPGYKTKEESMLNLKGEIAFMIPDPNTKKSRIPSDNNESVAYIDDFEGSKKIISLGLNPLSWIVSSIPNDESLLPPGSFNINTKDSLTAIRRSNLQWYNLINNVDINEVYPNKQLGNNQNKYLTPMVFRINPNLPGMFTYLNQNSFLSNEPNPLHRWSGVFKYLNTSQTNLLDENINFVEIWMQINRNVPVNDSAKMLIDLGIISEKIIANADIPIPNGLYHTEDLNNNGTLDEGEDVGLDGWSNAEEIAKYPNLGADPSGDNFAWTQGSEDFTQFDGTEGNSNLTEGKRIDTEDLDGNGSLGVLNNYFEYQINLSDTVNNPYIKGRGNNGWFQFSIPLDQYKRLFNQASLTNVQYIRVWFKGFNDTAVIKIVDFNLVGNQWQKTNKSDTTFSISVVNIEDNSNIYNSPVPGDILRQRDPTSVDQTTLLNEQSMSLDVRNLVQGQGKFATKYFNTRPVDLLNYKILKLFVNGDPSFKYVDTSNYDAAMVVRVGSDSLNYYEYRAPIHPDIRPSTPWNAQNEVTINLADFTAIKQLRDSLNQVRYYPVPNGPPGSKYGVIGNPTINGITIMQLGVVNNHGPFIAHPLTGSIWFNEMRVLKAENKSGYAFTLSAGLKMADFGTLNFSYSKTDPYFHSLENRFGNRILSNSWEFSGTLNLHKLLNSLLSSLISVKLKDFLTIPFTFSHIENFEQPKFLPNTDIDLETAVNNKYKTVLEQTGNPEIAQYYADELRISAQNLRVTNRFSVNGFKFTFPGDNFVVKELLNKIESNFYFNSTKERTPTSQSRSQWDMGGNIGFTSNLRLLDDLHLNIGKLIPLGDEYKNAKLYFFFPFFGLAPLFSNNLGAGLSFTRAHGDEQLRNSALPNPTSRNFNANRNISMEWKFIENWIIDLTGNYQFTAGSDLTGFETYNDSLKSQKSGSQILNEIFFKDKLINFGKDLTYAQTVNINPKFNIPIFKNFIDLTTSYRVSYAWAPTQSEVYGNNVGYNADFQTSAFIKLKSIFELFKSSDKPKIMGGSEQQDGQNPEDLFKLIKTFIPDQLTVSYSQGKTLTNQGVAGKGGFSNFWVNLGTQSNAGPSRTYQLGWTNDPGPRLGNLQLTDREGYNNTLNLSTFINPIFPNNLKISFTYKTTWSQNKQLSYITDQFGNLGLPTNVYNLRTFSRPTFLFSTNNITGKLAKPSDTLDFNVRAKQISDSFKQNIVSFPFPGWTMTLTGVEKFDMFSGFASSITIENGYTSEYKESIKFTGGPEGEITEQQSITSGFSPLLGINVTFKPIAEGNLTASLKINKTTNYDLIPSTPVLNNTNTSDISINATYTKSGFKIPLFGLSLDNDLSISFSYTRTTNDPRTIKYDALNLYWSDDALNGSISTSLNPAIIYALSKSVSVQLFYKYTKVQPTEGSIAIPTRTSNEAGLNVKLTIQ
jgi:hypothetical protein